MGWPGALCAAPGVGPAEGQAAHLVRTWLGVFFRWRDWAAWLARPSSRVAAPADMMPPGRCGVLDKVLPFEGLGGSEGVPLGLARVLWKAAAFPTPFTGESPAAAWTLALPACLQPEPSAPSEVALRACGPGPSYSRSHHPLSLLPEFGWLARPASQTPRGGPLVLRLGARVPSASALRGPALRPHL